MSTEKPTDKGHKKSLSLDVDEASNVQNPNQTTPSNYGQNGQNPLHSDDRYLNKEVDKTEVHKVKKPIEYKQASEPPDSQRQTNEGIENMIGQVKIVDGKEDLEATFGKDEAKNTLKEPKKTKNSKYQPLDRKTRFSTSRNDL